MSTWLEDLIFIANERNRLSHVFARFFLFVAISSTYVAVVHRQLLAWTIPIAVVSAAIGVGLYSFGEWNEAKDIAEHRRKLRETARR